MGKGEGGMIRESSIETYILSVFEEGIDMMGHLNLEVNSPG